MKDSEKIALLFIEVDTRAYKILDTTIDYYKEKMIQEQVNTIVED